VVFAVRPLNVVPVCQPLVGKLVDVLMAYCTVWLPGFNGIVTAFTVILLIVGVPFRVGTPLVAAPSPIDNILAVTVPVSMIALIVPVTLDAGILVGSVTILVFAL